MLHGDPKRAVAVGLREERAVAGHRAPGKRAGQVDPAPGAGHGAGVDPGPGRERRKQVDQTHRLVDGAPGGDAGPGDDQRDLQEIVVERPAMAEEAVVHEFLAMIGHEDDVGAPTHLGR